MFRRRRSFKVAPGIKVNTGKRGITSVNVAGVNLGTSTRRGRSGGRKPTKAEQQATFWRIKPGPWYVRFETDDDDYLNLEVRGSELTYDRFKKMSEAAFEKNAATEARIFRQFVASWDMEDENHKIAPISAATLQKVSNGFFYGLTVEIVNALKIPKNPLDSVLENAKTNKPYPIKISNKPFPDTVLSDREMAKSTSQYQGEDAPITSTTPTSVESKSRKTWVRKFFTGLIILFLAIFILAAVL